MANQSRPERSKAVDELMHDCTLRVRQNIDTLIEADKKRDADHPLTYHQLGKRAGYSSAIVYQALTSEPPRNNIGIQTIARFSLALKVTPHELLLPPKSFRKEVLPKWLERRGVK